MKSSNQLYLTFATPLITIHISSLNGSSDIEVLPDSGADISAAGKETLSYFNEHIHNLLPSGVTPSKFNGAKMHPLGKLPVKLWLGNKDTVMTFTFIQTFMLHFSTGKLVRNLASYLIAIHNQSSML